MAAPLRGQFSHFGTDKTVTRYFLIPMVRGGRVDAIDKASPRHLNTG